MKLNSINMEFKTHLKLFSNLFLIILGIGLSFNGYSQKGQIYKDLSYTVTTTHHVSIDDGVSLKDIPDFYLTEVTNSEITKSYKEYLDSRDNPQAEITFVSSKDYFPKWQTLPKKFVHNQDGTSCYFEDSADNFVLPLDETEVNDYNEFKHEILEKGFGDALCFSIPSEEDLNTARSKGFQINKDKQGNIKMNNGNTEINIDTANGVISLINTNKDGNAHKVISIFGNKFDGNKLLSERIEVSGFELGKNLLMVL